MFYAAVLQPGPYLSVDGLTMGWNTLRKKTGRMDSTCCSLSEPVVDLIFDNSFRIAMHFILTFPLTNEPEKMT